MKKMNWILAMMLTLPMMSFAAGSSSGTRGGGNASTAEFYNMMNEILMALTPLSPLQTASGAVDVTALVALSHQVQVIPTNGKMVLKGSPLDAINYPDQKKIVFSLPRWQQLANEERSQLVIHELLGVARIADVQYATSKTLTDILARKTGGRISLLDSGDMCEGQRSFDAIKALRLVKALAAAGIPHKGDMDSPEITYEVAQISCTETSEYLTDDGAGYQTCEPVVKGRAGSLLIMNALAELGVWTEGAAGHHLMDAKNIKCTVKTSPYSWHCEVEAMWSWGCKKP